MNFMIIAGTEKAGTTSLFEYLGQHPDITTSRRKETDYFRRKSCALGDYLDNFRVTNESNLLVEASPAYLGLADSVFPRIKKVVPTAKIVVLLRDPIQRLRSSYLFHRSQQKLPSTLSLDDYTSLCLDYHEGKIRFEETGLRSQWFLNVLTAAKYSKHLRIAEQTFGNNLLCIDFEGFKNSPRKVVEDVCKFAGVDPSFYGQFDFFIANKTFQPKNGFFHKISLSLNNALEPFFRRHPVFKRKIVAAYKAVNEGNALDQELSSKTQARLIDYYLEDYEYCQTLFSKRQGDIIWESFEGRQTRPAFAPIEQDLRLKWQE